MAINEKQFTEQLIGENGIATMLGWQAAHFRPLQDRRGRWRTPVSGELGEGWPDWFLANPGQRRSMLRELKIDGKALDPDQERVIGILQAAGVDADVWRPADFDSGRIMRELLP